MDEIFNAESGNIDYDDDQSMSSRSHDRLTMTSAYCSRQRVASASATTSNRQQKRQGKAAHRARDLPTEDRIRRGDAQAAKSPAADRSTGDRREPTGRPSKLRRITTN